MISPTTGAVFAWIKTTESVALQEVLQRGSGASGNYFLRINAGGDVRGHVQEISGEGNAAADVVAVAGVDDGVFHHIGFTWNGTTGELVLYVDGVERGSDIDTGLNAAVYNDTLTVPMAIGAAGQGGPTIPFKGVIDDVRIYKDDVPNAADIWGLFKDPWGSIRIDRVLGLDPGSTVAAQLADTFVLAEQVLTGDIPTRGLTDSFTFADQLNTALLTPHSHILIYLIREEIP